MDMEPGPAARQESWDKMRYEVQGMKKVVIKLCRTVEGMQNRSRKMSKMILGISNGSGMGDADDSQVCTVLCDVHCDGCASRCLKRTKKQLMARQKWFKRTMNRL